MSTFMPYALLVSCVLSAAAAMAACALAAFERPTRGVWLAALLASAALPFALIAARDAQPAGAAPSVSAPAESGAPSASGSAPSAIPQAGIDWQQWTEWAEWSGWRALLDRASAPAVTALDDALLVLWLAGSAVVLVVHAAAWLALRRALERWPRARIDGTEVAVSDSVGPAVFGVVDPSIIVPMWLLDASSAIKTAVIRHERAHVAAGDTRWLGAGLLAAALVPWNPVMWWQLKRLRTAVELDCDARVVRAGTDASAYARALVAVAQRRGRLNRAMPLLAAAATTGPVTQLERRVRRLLQRRKGSRALAGLFAGGAVVALAAACAVEPPARSPAEPVSTCAADTRAREFAREPLTGAAVGGERVVVLVDVSASMLDRTAEGAARRVAASPAERRRAPKWQQLVETVDGVMARIPPNAMFQVILFADDARAALPATEGQWLAASQSTIERSLDVLRNEAVPAGRRNLRAAFDAAAALDPPPDIIHVVVDGLPDAGARSANAPSEQERMELFAAARDAVPDGAAVNVLLMPKEGEGIAAAAYWTLTHCTGGALVATADGIIRSAVPGVPLDAEYLLFVVDTSGSMRQYAAGRVQRQIREVLDAHTGVAGIQVLNDMGEHLFERYGDEWIPNTPSMRESILEALPEWSAFSNSSPREGLIEAIDTFYDPDERTSIFVIGDDLAREAVDVTLEALEEINRDAETGAIKMRVNAVAIPVYLDVAGELLSAAQYALAMREISMTYGGAFIALPASDTVAATD